MGEGGGCPCTHDAPGKEGNGTVLLNWQILLVPKVNASDSVNALYNECIYTQLTSNCVVYNNTTQLH